MEIEVKNCAGCPFREQVKDIELCNAGSFRSKTNIKPFRKIKDRYKKPQSCPLRKEPITIKLKS